MLTTTQSVIERNPEIQARVGQMHISTENARFSPTTFTKSEVEKRITAPVESERQATVQAEKPVEKLSTASKLLLGVYVFVALVLSAVVAVTGIVIGDKATSVGKLSKEVGSLTSAVSVQTAQIETLSNEETIREIAKSEGMQVIEGKEIELLPESGATQYTYGTNGFDKFCDWVSMLIGG